MHGPTAEDNLVSLCGTCHKGLDPDFEPTLRELARLPGRAAILDLDGTEHEDEVSRYRALMSKVSSAEPYPAVPS